MRKITQALAGLLLLAAVAAGVFVIHSYQRERDGARLTYTKLVKLHDRVDAARNSLAALNDAEVRAQNYVLTGETTYSVAWAASVRTWQDELETLKLLTMSDPARPLVQDFSKAGERLMEDLVLVKGLYDGGSRDKALDRIRKGSAIVYLDEARDITGKILEVDQEALDKANHAIANESVSPLQSLAGSAAVLFAIVIGTMLLLVFETRGRPGNKRGADDRLLSSALPRGIRCRAAGALKRGAGALGCRVGTHADACFRFYRHGSR